MLIPLIKPLFAAVFFLLVFAGSSEAAVVKVSPANVQASIDRLPESTPDSDKPKSLQAIIADSATYAGDEDVIEFAAGTYDDVGELLITRPLTLRKDPAAEGDAVITGELLIHIRSKEVKVEDLTFRDLELGDATVLRDGEVNRGLTGPYGYYFGDVTIQSFLLDRKAKVAAWKAAGGTGACPENLPDCAHDYSSYTGQLHYTELERHLVPAAARRFEFFPQKLISDKKTGIPKHLRQDRGASTFLGDRWNNYMSVQAVIRDSFGHILINPRWNVGEQPNPRINPAPTPPPCPASEAFTGIEITRNSFDGTEVRAIFSIKKEDWNLTRTPIDNDVAGYVAGVASGVCDVDIKVVGNTFRNIGVADYAYLVARDENGLPRTDSSGNPVFIMDGNGNRVPNHAEDENTMQFWDVYRKVTISDNTFEGSTFSPIRFRTRQGYAPRAEITISNNLIREFTSGGNRAGGSLIGIRGARADTKITISGNRLLASDNDAVYNTVYYRDFLGINGRAAGCPDIDGTTTITRLDEFLRPVIAQSYVPSFPYPPLDGSGNVVDADDPSSVGTKSGALATPVRLIELARSSATVRDFDITDADDGILKSDDIMIGKYDIVLYRLCTAVSRIAAIFIQGDKDAKISLVDNDINYGEGAALISSPISLSGVGGDPAPGFEAFSGNNMDNYRWLLLGGPFSGSLAVKGNYIGQRPRVPRDVTLDRTGEILEPIAREDGALGPRAGMNADSRPEVPRIASASVSPTARNMIVVTYDADLAAESVPPATAFTVQYRLEGSERIEIVNASGVSVSGMTVTVTLAREIPSGAVGVTVVYTAPDGDAAVRSMLGSVAAGNQRSPVTTGDDDGGDTGDPVSRQPDGGCALASSESGGAGLGMLLFLTTVVVSFAFTAGRERRHNA